MVEKGLMQEHLVDDLAVKERSYWWHQVRRHNLLRYLEKHLPEGGHVLEIGCGTGANLRALRDNGYLVSGLELDPNALAYCGDLQVLRADATAPLPYRDGSFDAVILLDVLEHLADPDGVIDEISRIIGREGLVVVMVPADPGLWSYWDEMLGHHRRYTGKTLSDSFGDSWRRLDLSYSFSWMYLPVKIFRGLKRGRVDHGHTDFVPLPGWINSLLVQCGRLESAFQDSVKIPVGTTVGGIWRKAERDS